MHNEKKNKKKQAHLFLSVYLLTCATLTVKILND